MRFRQVHLDFHTSELIEGIGKSFSREQFQASLKAGHVDSITVFAKCHHGWAYFPSEENEIHPHLDFDLLGEQIAAAHEIGVKVPVYLSAGLDEKEALRHPEWLIRREGGLTQWASDFSTPGYHEFCLNSPYLQKLIRQTEEVVRKYDADGIFLDIVGIRKCQCHNCIRTMREEGFDPFDPAVVTAMGERIYANYTSEINAAIRAIKPDMKIFHNGGHIRRGRRDLAHMNTHLELESLPTGGWGYDHFPLSAAYARTLGMDFLGMTGKFHTTWGEFGGFKHPNALRYENALALAFGARISVGDQLHPNGFMDPATYELIGAGYSEVEAKEAWIVDAQPVVDIGVLSVESCSAEEIRVGDTDAGIVRILLETKALFDVIDMEADFNAYKLMVLPDKIRITPSLGAKLQAYIAQGGKLLASGESGLAVDKDEFVLDLGVRYTGKSQFRPTYLRPSFDLPSLKASAFVCYAQAYDVELNGGVEIGSREEPYFNRAPFAFSSHQHTPNDPATSAPCIVESANGIYIAWDVFEDYAAMGSIVYKEVVANAIDRILKKTVITNLPAQGVVTLTKQDAESRYVLHALYGSPVRRGKNIEVIEDLPAIHDTKFRVSVAEPVSSVTLAPQGVSVPFEQGEGAVEFTIPSFSCHQMVEIKV